MDEPESIATTRPGDTQAFTTREPLLSKTGITSAANIAQFQQDMLAFAKCMRSHGVSDFPLTELQTGASAARSRTSPRVRPPTRRRRPLADPSSQPRATSSRSAPGARDNGLRRGHRSALRAVLEASAFLWAVEDYEPFPRVP